MLPSFAICLEQVVNLVSVGTRAYKQHVRMSVLQVGNVPIDPVQNPNGTLHYCNQSNATATFSVAVPSTAEAPFNAVLVYKV